MKYLLILLLTIGVLEATEVQPYAALQMGYGDGVLDKKFYNPQGRFGVRYVTEYADVYVEHISSIPNANDGLGLNSLGGNVKTPNYKGFDGLAGVGYRPNDINKYQYSKNFRETFYRYAVRYKSGDKYLYVESIESKMYSFGIEWVF